ncbi:hypothetical protein GS982_18705 [Rhodococcus hoagii]|nr:hypothetical protein [Prescottella equi]
MPHNDAQRAARPLAVLQHAAGGTPDGTQILGVVMVADTDRRLSSP